MTLSTYTRLLYTRRKLRSHQRRAEQTAKSHASYEVRLQARGRAKAYEAAIEMVQRVIND